MYKDYPAVVLFRIFSKSFNLKKSLLAMATKLKKKKKKKKLLKIGENVCLNGISDKCNNWSCWVKN